MYIEPRPDESSYSLLARAHLQTGARSPAESLWQLTGRRGHKPLSGLPTGSKEIVARIGLGIDVDEWVHKHTLFPLFRPFVPQQRLDFIRESIRGSGAAKSRLGLLRSHCGAMEQLAYCSRCNDLAVSQFGHAYWTRATQLNGVAVCAHHQLPLLKIAIEDLPWKSRALVLPEAGQEMRIPDDKKGALAFISQQVGELLNDRTNIAVQHQMYVDILRSAGLYTKMGRVRGRLLTSAIRRWLKPIRELQPFDQLLSSLGVERNWATIAVACEGGFTHPLKHIVIWGAIGSTWRDLVDSAFSEYHQMELKLRVASSPPPPTDAMVLETLQRTDTLTAAAGKLGCDVTTMGVWAD